MRVDLASDAHALDTGRCFGRLALKHGIEVTPLRDDRGNFTRQARVSVDGREYLLTVDPVGEVARMDR